MVLIHLMAGRTAVQRRAGEGARLSVRAPAQTRAQETMDRIVAATQRLLRTQRFEDITIAQIVAEADTSTGSFYARFGSKDALLPYLYAAYNANAAAATDELETRGVFNVATLRDAVRAFVGVIREGPLVLDGLVRTMVLYARSHPERLPQSAYKRSARFFTMMSGVFTRHMRARDADRRARFVAFAAMTLLREHRFFADAPLAKALGLSPDAFAAEVEKMMAAYLEAK